MTRPVPTRAPSDASLFSFSKVSTSFRTWSGSFFVFSAHLPATRSAGTGRSSAKIAQGCEGKLFNEWTKADWPRWIRDLAERLGATELLVTGVGDQREIFGLLVVDRAWQSRSLSHTDSRALETFARQIALLILRQHSISQQVLISREIECRLRADLLRSELELDVPQTIGTHSLIPQLLLRALHNLISNTLDAIERGGHPRKVKLSARLEDNWDSSMPDSQSPTGSEHAGCGLIAAADLLDYPRDAALPR